MKKLLLIPLLGLMFGMNMQAEDHVLAATKSSEARKDVPAVLELSLKDAQNYAIAQNRSLKNASLAVQEAYAQRWQTIAAMLPQVDGTVSYTNMLGYEINFGAMTRPMLPYLNVGPQVAVGFNVQGVIGVLLNNVAIDMKKISL